MYISAIEAGEEKICLFLHRGAALCEFVPPAAKDGSANESKTQRPKEEAGTGNSRNQGGETVEEARKATFPPHPEKPFCNPRRDPSLRLP